MFLRSFLHKDIGEQVRFLFLKCDKFGHYLLYLLSRENYHVASNRYKKDWRLVVCVNGSIKFCTWKSAVCELSFRQNAVK